MRAQPPPRSALCEGLGCVMAAARGAGLFASEESIVKLIIIMINSTHR